MHTPQQPVLPWASDYHAPVLAEEVLSLLRDKRAVLDGTLGGGGHTLALLERGAMVTALDRDPQAVAAARERLEEHEASGCFRPVLGNYADAHRLPAIAGAHFDGILLDLGVSSHQLDDAVRGFSFREGAPLDMRMGESDESAADVLNGRSERELTRLFREYGDEPRGARLAREVVRRRATRPFATSDDLVGAIRAVLGARSGAPVFARLFQAVRIATNDELALLERALPALRDLLHPGGVLVVIAYHSGEDRIVKDALRDWSAACVCPPRHPICTCRGKPLGHSLTRKPVLASDQETARNARARSAKLRAWQSAA
ncbi:MAG: 16S rRNA (cytosine(1402)-N(4))-methyltransferase RsmH [Gemmatimonadaceae bacterium]